MQKLKEQGEHSAMLSSLVGSKQAWVRKLNCNTLQWGTQDYSKQRMNNSIEGIQEQFPWIQQLSYYFHFLIRAELVLPRSLLPKLKTKTKKSHNTTTTKPTPNPPQDKTTNQQAKKKTNPTQTQTGSFWKEASPEFKIKPLSVHWKVPFIQTAWLEDQLHKRSVINTGTRQINVSCWAAGQIRKKVNWRLKIPQQSS